ncbi:hypothetical protein RCJ22_13950, partial [Vibrio sp. FNV 38]|nr:hypothetical protein [Vibrio sp. FNV 38]
MNKEQVVEIVKEVIDYQLMDGWAYILLFVGSLLSAFIGARLKASAEISAVNKNFIKILGQQK